MAFRFKVERNCTKNEGLMSRAFVKEQDVDNLEELPEKTNHFWTSLGSRLVQSRALSRSAPSAAAPEPSATTIVSMACIMSASRLNSAAFWNSGRPTSSALDFVQRYDAFTFAAGPCFQFGDDQFMSAYFSVTPAEAFLNGHVYPYQATGGLAAVGGFGSVKYQFTPA